MGGFESYALVPEQGAVPQMAQLDAAMQQRIAGMASRLNVHDGAAVMGFGARAQKEMGLFADMALARMLERDNAPLTDVMAELAAAIRGCSFAKEAQGFFRRMLGKAAPLDEVRAAYEKAEPRISACADDMLRRRVELMNDSALLERLYEKNESLYRELCSLIVVGEEAIRQARARREEMEIIARLERRVEDLRVTQLSSTQLAAQIRMIQQSDDVACDKLRTALETTIPLWKSQMAAALGLARAAESMTMHRRTEREAARGVRQGAQELRAQGRAYAKAAQESEQQRARETAQALLEELESIETELKRDMTAKA